MLLLKNGKIFTMGNGQIVYGDILIDKGKIIDINCAIHETDAQVIDIKNHIVTPGFIDGHSHIGLVGNDKSELYDTMSPHLRVEDGVNLADDSFYEAVKSGVTTVAITPGDSNVIGGQSCVIKTYGDTLEERLIKLHSTLNISIGEFVKNLDDTDVKMPRSRMAITYMIRSFLTNAKRYYENTKDGNVDRDSFNEKYESVKPIFTKDMKVEICAHKAQDIQTALRLKEEFGFDLILTYCTEAHLIEDKIDNDIPLMMGPYLTDKSNFEIKNRDDSSPTTFSNKGFNTCLITNHPDITIDLLSVCAAIGIKNGMSYENALKSITINPAKALGIDNRVGSIEVGKDADLVVFDGDPFKARTKAVFTIVDGKIAYRR